MKISLRQMFLTIIFIIAFLSANIMAAKQLAVFWGFVVDGGTITFPITFILSDVFSEVYGYKWSRIASVSAFAMNFFAVVLFQIVIALPPADFFTGQEAFETVLGNTPRIFFASSVTFLISDWVDDLVFRAMKRKHIGIAGFESRAFWSSVVGELTNAIMFAPLAFYGVIPFEAIIMSMITVFFMQIGLESICLPITSVVVRVVNRAEGLNKNWNMRPYLNKKS